MQAAHAFEHRQRRRHKGFVVGYEPAEAGIRRSVHENMRQSIRAGGDGISGALE